MANQTVQLSSILTNFNHVTEATATAYNSAGSAARENSAAVDSLKGRTQLLKAEFQDLATNVIDNQLVKIALGGLTTALEILNNPMGTFITQVGLLTAGGWSLQQLVSVAKIAQVALANLTNTAGAATIAFGGLQLAVLPTIAALSALTVGGYALYKIWREENPTLEETADKLHSLNDQLENNKVRLEEIDKLPWYEYTDEIDAERIAIEKENDAIDKQIAKLEQRQSALSDEKGKEPSYKLEGEITYQSATLGKTFSSREEAIQAIQEIAHTKEEVTQLVQELEQLDSGVVLTGTDLEKYLIRRAAVLSAALEQNGQLTAEQNKEYQQLLPTMQAVGENSEVIRKITDNLTATYETAKESATKYADSIKLTEDEYNNLINQSPNMKDALEDVGNGYYDVNVAANDAALGLITSDGRILDSNKKMVKTALANLITLMEGYRSVYQSLMGSYGDLNPAYLQLTPEQLAAKKAYESTYSTIGKLQAAIIKSEKEGYVGAPLGGGGISTTQKTKDPKKEVEDTLAVVEKTEEVLDDEADILQTQTDALNAQKSAYEALFALGSEVANDRIADLQKELELLEAENDALEDSIKLQELQEDLAKAKAKQVLVYKDGKFQYVSDTEGVSSARQALVEYEQQKIIEEEKKRINEQIKYWQEWGNKWSSAVNDYSKTQNELLVLEQFGISKEDEIWNTRIENLQDFVDEYASLTNKLTALQSGANQAALEGLQKPAAGGATVTDLAGNVINLGEGLSLDWTKNPSGGWTEEELAGGFIVSGSGGQNLDTSANWAIKPTAMSRDESKAGQTVTEGGYTISYDELGYATSRTKNASGTTYAQRGISLVGEEGPELRLLNQGDGILPADITRNLWKWGAIAPDGLMNVLSGVFSQSRGSGNQNINIEHISLPNVTDGQSFVDFMRNNFWRSAVQFSTT